MGASDIVPGVSGGTMAFILGVYQDLIDAIKSFNIEALQLLVKGRIQALLEHLSLRFLVALGAGILLAIFILSGFLSALMEDVQGRILLFAFFFGLVLASILTIGAKVRWNSISLVSWIVGTVVAFAVVNLVPTEADHSPPILVISGMIAITAMILPGISGSFMLLILGQYDYVLVGGQQSRFAAGHLCSDRRCNWDYRLFARLELLAGALLQSDGGALGGIHGGFALEDLSVARMSPERH